MNYIKNEKLSGERALFKSKELTVENTLFFDGESPLKESSDLVVNSCTFDWKYPLWYCRNVAVNGGKLNETARAGIWYTDNLTMDGTLIEAPKTFRRCDGLTLNNIRMPNAQETLWSCKNVCLEKAEIKGDYLAMNSENMRISNLVLEGNYPFDGAKNIEIHNSRLLSKDAFWNSENVTVYDSYISGEYLGWNAKNLTFINCTIESLQGLCYIENLRMVNCKLVNTTLAFEYSTVDAQIVSEIDSVLNPSGGTIQAKRIKELMIDKELDGKTRIITKE